MSAPPTNETCRLCGKVEYRRWSHCVSKFFVRGYWSKVVTGTNGEEQPFSRLISTVPGIESGQKQHGRYEEDLGIVEHLLCGECEEKFGRYENWFRQNFYLTGRSDLVKKPITSRTRMADYDKFKLFVLSLLWRASVASGKFFRRVSLGPVHEEQLASILRSENSGPSSLYEFAIFDMRLDGPILAGYRMEDYVEEPRFFPEMRICALYVGGFMVLVHISDAVTPVPDEIRQFSLRESGEFSLICVDDYQRQGNFLRYAYKIGAIPTAANGLKTVAR